MQLQIAAIMNNEAAIFKIHRLPALARGRQKLGF
jgi:hypothetical protein